MTKEEIIEDLINIMSKSELHRDAAEKIYDKYIAKSTEGTGGVTINVSDNYCKMCGGLLPNVGWWASGAEPVRCKCEQIQFDVRVTAVHKCPVCEGNGLVPNGFYNQVTGVWSGTSTTPETCRSCGGAGIIKT